MFEMIRRQRAVARGKRGAVAVRQLLGMDLDRQAVRSGGLEHAFGLRGGETHAFAKGIDRIGTPGPGDRRNHRVAHRADIGRSEEHTSELQSLMRISYAVLRLKEKNKKHTNS